MIILSAPARGMPESPQPIQCPGSNAHVWDKDQCPRIGGGGAPGSFPGGGAGGGGGGLLGAIGRVVGGLGGLL